MPKQTITDLMARPEFSRLPKERQEDLIRDWTMGSMQPDSDSMSELPQSAASKFALQDIGGKSLAKRLEGAAVGGGTGAMWGGGWPGGIVGGALGAAFPPEKPGDYAVQLMGGPMAKGANKMVKMVKPGFLRTLASGGAGAGLTELFHGGSELTNRLFNSTGLSNTPKGSVFTDDPLTLAIGSLPAAASTHFLGNKVAKNPIVKTNDFVNEQLGTKSPLSQVSNIADRSTDPRLQSVLQASENPAMSQNIADRTAATADLQAANVVQKEKDVAIATLRSQLAGRATQQKKSIAETLRKKIGLNFGPDEISEADKLHVGQIEKLETDLTTKEAALKKANLMKESPETKSDLLDEITGAKLNLLQSKANIVQEKAIEAATRSNTDPSKLAQANIGTSTSVTRKAIANQMLEKKKIGTDQELLRQSITNLKNDAGTIQDAMNPILRKIAWDNPDPAQLVQGFMKDGTPEAIKAFTAHLSNQPGGKANVEAFQNSMLQEFFKRAFDPQTKTLSNAQALFSPDGPFSAQKIEALYGPEKVGTFRQVFDDIKKVTDESTNPGSILKHTVDHFFGWSLPMAFMYSRGSSPSHMAVGGALAGAGLAAIAWPRFINSMLKNPKTADRFHQWATSDVTQRNLKNWPTLAQFFDQNSEPVNDVINTPN